MQQQESYDYIITGAGCAGLSLVMHLVASQKFTDKKILIVDKDAKNKNDRTWCFWEKEAGIFEPVVYKKWEQLWFYTDDFSKQLAIAPYSYKLIRGLDLYQYCMTTIRQQANITFLQESIKEIISNEMETCIVTENKKIAGRFIFNSILFQKPQLTHKQYWLLQHFRGWTVETEQDVFNDQAATLMDFRTNQKEGTTFFYVLPFSPRKALIEYTLFSHNKLESEAYDTALNNYITNRLGLNEYRVIETENGVIPMTNFIFPGQQHHILNIGTAGGQTKSSSGYTFQFIQKHSRAITESLVQNGHPFSGNTSKSRFRFYDHVLLHILHQRTLNGDKIFSRLFERNKPVAVLQFLDNETSLSQELRIISSLPTAPFLKAALRIL